jgi:hypothetical protein
MMKNTMNRKITGLLIALIIFAGLPGCTSKSDITGKWKGTMTLQETGKSLSDLEFDLSQKAGEITGFMIFTRVEGGKAKLTGTRTGDVLKFSTEHQKGLTVHVDGTVNNRARITGTAVLVYSDPKVPVKQDTVTLELTR